MNDKKITVNVTKTFLVLGIIIGTVVDMILYELCHRFSWNWSGDPVPDRNAKIISMLFGLGNPVSLLWYVGLILSVGCLIVLIRKHIDR